MDSATFVEGLHIELPRDRHPAALPGGVILSALFHLSVALLVMFSPWTSHEIPPPQFVMEVVQLPTPPEKVVEPARQGEAPSATIKPSSVPIVEEPAPPPPVAKTPTPPQERRPPAPRVAKAPETPAVRALPNSDVAPLRATPDTPKPLASPLSGGNPEPASQNVQEFVLSQIARVWVIDLHSPKFRDLDIVWTFVLRPDGMLDRPFGKNDPWDLEAMVDPRTYAIMKEPTERGRYYTTIVTTFLQAVRQSQPFRLPPNEQSYVNRALPLRFHAGDLVQSTSQNR